MVADRDLIDEIIAVSAKLKPVLGNLGDSLPDPLDFVLDKPLSVSDVSKTLGFGEAQEIQKCHTLRDLQVNAAESWLRTCELYVNELEAIPSQLRAD